MGKNSRVFIIGVGMTAFQKPRGKVQYHELGLEAATKALLDAGITYDEVEAAFVGYGYGHTNCGQKILYQLGMTGIPITNCKNACATGSTALALAIQSIRAGNDCALVVGFEVMKPGPIVSPFTHMESPLELSWDITRETRPESSGVPNAIIFGNGAAEYCEKYGATWDHVAAISSKAHDHCVNNPYSQFRNKMTVEQVKKDHTSSNYMTRAMCCPTSDGAASNIVASEEFVKKHGLEGQAIEVLAQSFVTDDPLLYSKKSSIELTGANMTRRAAQNVFKQTGLSVEDVGVVELHDCFAANELLVYDGLGLCKPGEAHKLVERKDNTYGGKFVVNPSGGLLTKGHPLGATGPGMIFYLTNQLRGISGPMQVDKVAPGSKSRQNKALAHNLGLGGACVVTLLGRPDFYKQGAKDGRARLGYEFGYECRGITRKDIDKVRSRKNFFEPALIAKFREAKL